MDHYTWRHTRLYMKNRWVNKYNSRKQEIDVLMIVHRLHSLDDGPGYKHIFCQRSVSAIEPTRCVINPEAMNWCLYVRGHHWSSVELRKMFHWWIFIVFRFLKFILVLLTNYGSINKPIYKTIKYSVSLLFLHTNSDLTITSEFHIGRNSHKFTNCKKKERINK